MMALYDKENCAQPRRRSEYAPRGVLSNSSNGIRTRKSWLDSGNAEKPSLKTFTGSNKSARNLSSGVIAKQKKWVEQEMSKGPMTAAPKGQDIAGPGIIARQRKWAEEQMSKGPMTAAPKGQDIAGSGIIARQRKWAMEQMNKGPMTAAPKGQDIAGSGIIARQRKWAMEQMNKGPMTAAPKGQDIAGSGITARQRKWAEEQTSKGPMTSTQKDQNIAENGVIERQRKWAEEQTKKAPMTSTQKDQNFGDKGVVKRQKQRVQDHKQKQLPFQSPSKEYQILASQEMPLQQMAEYDDHEEAVMKEISVHKSYNNRYNSFGNQRRPFQQKNQYQQQEQRQQKEQRRLSRGSAPKQSFGAQGPGPVKRFRTSIGAKTQRANRTATQTSTQSSIQAPAQAPAQRRESIESGPGCYLTFETDSGGRLMLCYKRSGQRPANAVGFWAAGEGKTIQGFKFNRNCGKSELIKGIAGGDSNRRRYFDGWCQFIKLAKAMKGDAVKFSTPGYGVEVDIYGFNAAEKRPYFMDLENGSVDVSNFDAIAVIPKHKDFLQGVKTMVLSTFLEMGAIAGSSTLLN